MTYTEIRPYPVPANVVMRTTLFALANMGAKLQAYNEDTGVIVATVSKWLGVQQNDIIVRVREFEKTAQLEIEAPDALKAQEVLKLIATYITDGAKIQANATMQWVDMQRQQANQAKRKQLATKARNLLPGASSSSSAATSSETAVVPVDSSGQALATTNDAPAAPTPIPDNPGVLVKNKEDRVVEIKIDPAVFTDRTSYLQVCEGCSAAVMRGSAYCSNCGRPLTLQAVQPELRNSAQKTAKSSLTYGLAAIALNLIPILLLILPLALQAETPDSFLTRFGASLTPLKIAIAAVIGIAPSMVLGWRAIALAQRASWYRTLPAVTENEGSGKSAVGNALGWLAIYTGLAWVLFIVIALL